MKTSGVSIALVMVIVALVAVNLVVIRDVTARGDASWLFGLTGSIVMANTLALGGFVLATSRGRTRPFLKGFELGGLAALAVYLLMMARFSNLILPLSMYVFGWLDAGFNRHFPALANVAPERFSLAWFFVWAAVFVGTGLPPTLVQLAVAWGAGAITRRRSSRREPA